MTQADPALERVERHVKHVRDFLYHLMTYTFVNALLVILDVRAGKGGQAVLGLDWAYWPVLFWGLGVVGHAISVFVGDERAKALYEKEWSKNSSSS